MKASVENPNKENKSKTAVHKVLQKRNKKPGALEFELPGIESDGPGIENTIQRAGLEPGSLTSQEVLQLHSTLGNQAVGRLLAGPLQKKEKENGNQNQNKTGMPDNLKSGIEQLSGLDMSDVQVQYRSTKPARYQALAYTQGTNIYVASGQEKHLPHEAWHVVQQKQGRVKPTMQIDGIAINDDVGLEKESEVMGAKAYYHSSPTPVQKMGGNRAPGNNWMSNVETRPRTRGRIPSSLVVQRLSVTTDNMSAVAERFADVADRQTVAIVKAGDHFKCYPQSHTNPIKQIADQYDNLAYIQQYEESGVHAEVSAINQEVSIDSIATSRKHCPRCEAAMDSKSITKESSGGNYTAKWVAPNSPVEITVENTYPAKAINGGDGQSGHRYLRDGSGSLSPVARSVWSEHHDKW